MNLPTTAAEVSKTFYNYDESFDESLSAIVVEPNGDSHRSLERIILEACAPRFNGLNTAQNNTPHICELERRGYIKTHFDSCRGPYRLFTPLGLERWIEIMRAVFHSTVDNPTGGV